MRITKKKIAWGIVLLILIAGDAICKMRWKVWSHDIPEIRYALTEDPQRVFLTFGNDGELSRNVSWVCGSVSKQAKLEHIKTGSGDTLLVDGSSKFLRTLGEFGYANWAKFRELSYSDSYSYRAWNDDHSSDWYLFTMQPDSTDRFSLVFIGDVQDTLRGKTRNFMENVRHRYPQTGFYMSAGDFTERLMNCYRDEAYQSVDSIVPVRSVSVSPGNHEYVKGLVRVLEKRFAYVSSYLLESRYENNNVYSIDYNDVTIIMLDDNRDPWLLFSRRKWPEKTLRASKKRWKIVVLHHSVYSIKSKVNNPAVCWMFDGLFRECGVDLVLWEHGHNYTHTTNKNDEGEMTTPLYPVSHASPKSYRLSFNDKYNRFGTGRRFHRHIDVTGDTLRVQICLEDDPLYGDVRITKNASDTQIIDNVKDIPEIPEMPARLSGKKTEEFGRNAEKWRNRSLVK